MNGKSAYSIVPPAPTVRAVQDEWGMFDPDQAGLQAAFRAVRDLNDPAIADNASDPADSDPEPAGRDNNGFARRTPGPARVVSQSPVHDDSVYDLTETETPPRRSKPADRGAVYTLEFPTRCSQCCAEITSVRVSRLLRTQVSFTSTLPRKGYIIVCPECDGILSAELSGLI